jgi:hypothetical protein
MHQPECKVLFQQKDFSLYQKSPFRNSYIDSINFHSMVWVDASGRANATNVEIILDDGTNNVIFDFDDSISGTRIMGHARIESWIETLKDATRNRRYDNSGFVILEWVNNNTYIIIPFITVPV